MLRLLTLLVALSAVVAVSACTASDGDGARETRSPEPAAGCGDCAEELAEVRADIEALPDVRELVALETYAASPTNGAGVRVELRSTSTGDPRVIDEVAGVIWQSGLVPVDEVFVTVEDASGALVRGGSPFDFTDAGRERATYEERWGPRPVG